MFSAFLTSMLAAPTFQPAPSHPRAYSNFTITSSMDFHDLARNRSGITTGVRVFLPVAINSMSSSISEGVKSLSRGDGFDPPGGVGP
jgi:hypothetical protein